MKQYIRIEIKASGDFCREICPYFESRPGWNGWKCDLFGTLEPTNRRGRIHLGRHKKCLEAERQCAASYPPDEPVRAKLKPTAWDRIKDGDDNG